MDKEITKEEAVAVLKAEQDTRIAEFTKEYQELCKKYNCEVRPQLIVIPTL